MKDRGREFSVLTEREMKREPFVSRSLTLVPRSLFLNRAETLTTQARKEPSRVDHFREP